MSDEKVFLSPELMHLKNADRYLLVQDMCALPSTCSHEGKLSGQNYFIGAS